MSGHTPDLPPVRKSLPHEPPPWIRDGSAFFITVCCSPRGINQLCNPATADILFESVCFRQKRGDWYVQLLLLMPDYLHGLMYFPGGPRNEVSDLNLERNCREKAGVSWQRDFFDHRIRDDESFAERADYIRMNLVRKRLVADATLWPFVWRAD